MMQAWIDSMSREWQKERAETQMTLGRLMDVLRGLKDERPVAGFGRPRSYRGYYSDLAFNPVEQVQSASELYTVCQGCMGKVFQGYKGGDYVMGELTPVWLAEWGDMGLRLMGLNTEGEIVTPILEAEDDA